jgi:hypothetical protein
MLCGVRCWLLLLLLLFHLHRTATATPARAHHFSGPFKHQRLTNFIVAMASGECIIEGAPTRLNEKSVLIRSTDADGNAIDYSVRYGAYVHEHPEAALSYFSYQHDNGGADSDYQLTFLASYQYTLKICPSLVGEAGYAFSRAQYDLVDIIGATPIRPLTPALLYTCLKLYVSSTFENTRGQRVLHDAASQKRRNDKDFSAALRKRIRSHHVLTGCRNITLNTLLQRCAERAPSAISVQEQRLMIGVVGYPYYFGGLYAVNVSDGGSPVRLDAVFAEFTQHGVLRRYVPRVISECEQERIECTECGCVYEEDTCRQCRVKPSNDDSDDDQTLVDWDEMYMYDTAEFEKERPGHVYDEYGYNPFKLPKTHIDHVHCYYPEESYEYKQTEEHWRRVDFAKSTYCYMRRLTRYDEVFTLIGAVMGYAETFMWMSQCLQADEFGFSYMSAAHMAHEGRRIITYTSEESEQLTSSGYMLRTLDWRPSVFELLRIFQWSPLLLMLTPDTVMKVDVHRQRFQQFEALTGATAGELFPLRSADAWRTWAQHHPMWRVWRQRMQHAQLDLAFYDPGSTCGLAAPVDLIETACSSNDTKDAPAQPPLWYSETAMPSFTSEHLVKLRVFFDTMVNDPHNPELRTVCHMAFDCFSELLDYWRAIDQCAINHPCVLLYLFTDLVRPMVHLSNGALVSLKDLVDTHALMAANRDTLYGDDNVSRMINLVFDASVDDGATWTLQWMLIPQVEDAVALDDWLDMQLPMMVRDNTAYDTITAESGADWVRQMFKRISTAATSTDCRRLQRCIRAVFHRNEYSRTTDTLLSDEEMCHGGGPHVVVVREDVPAPYGNRRHAVNDYLSDAVGDAHVFRPRLTDVLRVGPAEWMRTIRKHDAHALEQVSVMWIVDAQHWPVRYLHDLVSYERVCPTNIKHVILHGYAEQLTDSPAARLLFSRSLYHLEPTGCIDEHEQMETFNGGLRDAISRRVTVFSYADARRRDIAANGVFRMHRWLKAQVGCYTAQSKEHHFCMHPIRADGAHKKRRTWRIFTGTDADAQFIDEAVVPDMHTWWPTDMARFIYLSEVGESVPYMETFKRDRLLKNKGGMYMSPHTCQPTTARVFQPAAKKKWHTRVPFNVSTALTIDRWQQGQLDHVVCFVTPEWSDAQLVKAINMADERCFIIVDDAEQLCARLRDICA